MDDYASLSKTLVEGIGLRTSPVAIRILKKGEPMPEGYNPPEAPLRHCQAIMRARHGESLIVHSDMQGCPVGASVLGFIPPSEKIASGGLHYSMGLYGNQEASRRTIETRPALEPGTVEAIALCPLEDTKVKPDVIIVTGTPEQIFWLMPSAATFEDGGRVSVNMASILAACGDSTMVPYINGEMNISLGCFGCRKMTDIRPEEMILGIPEKMIHDVAKAVQTMSQGPIPKSRVK